MDQVSAEVTVIPLASAIQRPVPASRKTRDIVPPGYGRREQCRPFVAANGAGLSILSPFTWGYCQPENVPSGARSFRSPISGGCPHRVFYVVDEPARQFRGNQFALPESVTERTGPMAMPGLSFFERADQQGQIKLHLPYMLRTEEGTALLFVPPINRPRSDGLTLLSGLVETAWYADAVNMVFELPEADRAVHVETGEPLAQAIPVASSVVKTVPVMLEPHRRQVRDALGEMRDWRAAKGKDKSAYKTLARNR